MAQTHLGNLFRLLSVAFAPISTHQARLVASGTLQADARTTWEALGLPPGSVDRLEEGLSVYLGRGADDVMHELRREETRLFLNQDPPVASTEGVWRKKAEGYRFVSFMINSYSLEVEEFMRQCGVVKPKGRNEPVDSVHAECEFAGMLADGPDHLARLGKDPLALLDEFAQVHLKAWLPGFCDDVARESRAPDFVEAARLMGAFVKEL